MPVVVNQNRLAAWRRTPALMQDFHPQEKFGDQSGKRSPMRTAPAKASARLLRSAIGPLFVVVLAALAPITFSRLPAPDGPVWLAGPLSGHSILHFPR
jgi:hypothetical protein